jgi:hypothetical protein
LDILRFPAVKVYQDVAVSQDYYPLFSDSALKLENSLFFISCSHTLFDLQKMKSCPPGFAYVLLLHCCLINGCPSDEFVYNSASNNVFYNLIKPNIVEIAPLSVAAF